ncbi:MAG: DNA-3-methyladenine glycosylase I, partial [Phototrophicaceae bacterium]
MTAPNFPLVSRCGWVNDDPLYIEYHDHEWGRPLRGDDRKWFEMLILEGAQAGLSWITILKRRAGYQRAFDNFDVAKVAAYSEADVATRLEDVGIIRNRLKVNAAVTNAQAFITVQAEFGSFDAYMWGWVSGQPIINHWHTLSEMPAETDLSRQISKDLKRRGFTFVGPTIVYSLMQA